VEQRWVQALVLQQVANARLELERLQALEVPTSTRETDVTEDIDQRREKSARNNRTIQTEEK